MTNCQESDGCDTGACEGYPEGPCLTPPEYPYTMALFTLADSTGFFQNDYYKVSAFGGFNCDIAISPIEGTFRHEINNPKFCQATTKCTRNLLIFCPDNLRWDGLWPLVGCLPGGSDDCNKSGDEGFEFYRHYCPTSYIDKCDERTSEFQCGGVDGPGTSAEYLVEIDCPPL
ncbi:unnamed protein product, partial [Mesorhabditis belari]|uniref:Thaumatin-like protein n=1 Tax=Mesorhabditis belari TaxID=2138241 RepID=A0AAF3EQY8_9BILA